MTTYSPDLAAKLIAEARHHAECLAPDLGWTLKTTSIEWLRENAAAMADQLAAAQAHATELNAECDELNRYADVRDREMEHLRNQVRYVEGQRDDHRATLNRFADQLHVVHEDPKIEAAVFSALDELNGLRNKAKKLQEVVKQLQKAVDAWRSSRPRT